MCVCVYRNNVLFWNTSYVKIHQYYIHKHNYRTSNSPAECTGTNRESLQRCMQFIKCSLFYYKSRENPYHIRPARDL